MKTLAVALLAGSLLSAPAFAQSQYSPAIVIKLSAAGLTGDQALQTACNRAQGNTLEFDFPITVHQTLNPCAAASIKFDPGAILTVTGGATIVFLSLPTRTDRNIQIFNAAPSGIVFDEAAEPVPAAWFGANPASAADTAPALNTASASIPLGGQILMGVGSYQLQSQVKVLTNTHIVCPSNGATAGTAGVPAVSAGTVFDVSWGSGTGSSNNLADAAFAVMFGAGIENCGLFYPNQNYLSATPTEYGASIAAADNVNGNSFQKVVNNFCFNCYSFLDFRGSLSKAVGDETVTGNNGAPIAWGLRVNNQADWSDWSHNIFHACEYTIGGSFTTGLCNWQINFATSFEVGPADWMNLDHEQEFGYANGVLWDRSGSSTYASTGPLYIRDSQFDACKAACVLINPTVLNDGPIEVDITNNRFTPYDISVPGPSPVTGGIAAIANGDFTGQFSFQNNFMFGPMNYMVFVSNVIDATITNNRYSNATGVTTNIEPLVTVGSGNTLIFQGNYALGWPGTLDSIGTWTSIPFTPATYNFLH